MKIQLSLNLDHKILDKNLDYKILKCDQLLSLYHLSLFFIFDV